MTGAWIQRVVSHAILAMSAMSLCITPPVVADGGQLIAAGTLDGEQVVLFVQPSPPRAGVVHLELAGETVRAAARTMRLEGEGVSIELQFQPSAFDPIAVEVETPPLPEGNYSVTVPGLLPERVVFAVRPPHPPWWRWLPWLSPTGLVVLLALIRPRLLRARR